MHSFAVLDPQFAVYTLIGLIPNLLLILWAMARLSHEVRLLKQKNSMLEDDINLLDQSINNITVEFQGIRQIENRKASSSGRTPAPQTSKASE